MGPGPPRNWKQPAQCSSNMACATPLPPKDLPELCKENSWGTVTYQDMLSPECPRVAGNYQHGFHISIHQLGASRGYLHRSSSAMPTSHSRIALDLTGRDNFSTFQPSGRSKLCCLWSQRFGSFYPRREPAPMPKNGKRWLHDPTHPAGADWMIWPTKHWHPQVWQKCKTATLVPWHSLYNTYIIYI